MIIANKPNLIDFNKNLNSKIKADNDVKKLNNSNALSSISFKTTQNSYPIINKSFSFGAKSNLPSPAIIQAKILQKTSEIISDYKRKKVAEYIEEAFKEIIKKDSEREIPVFRKIKKGFIKKLAAKIVNSPDKSIKIAVAGESASGKTSFSRHLVQVCEGFNNPNLITMISCDNYYKPYKAKRTEENLVNFLKRTGYNIDSPEAVNLKRFKNEVKRIANGETVKIPKLDFITSTVTENAEEKKPARIILTEGLFTLTDKVKDIFDVCIYVHRKPKTIKRHWFERAPQRCSSTEEANYLWKSAKKGSERFVRPSRKNADIVINRKAAKQDRESVIKEIFETVKTSRKLLSGTYVS